MTLTLIIRKPMNPKEKAEELLRIFYNQMGMPLDCEWNDGCYNKFKDRNGLAKACALIAVDEIFEFMKMDDDHHEDAHFANSHWVHYLVAVKEEIKKL
jgi:hypothetical protein